MKAFFRWLGRVIGGALTIVLVLILFPYLSKLAAKVMPDESGAAIRTSAILASKLENSTRLETLKVEEDGVLSYDIQAAFIGSVATINAKYRYEGSFGIDLRKVELRVNGDTITFVLPHPEVLQDSLTPEDVFRDDFWYPGFSDDDYEKLMENERLARREFYLSGDQEAHLWDSSVTAFEQTIAAWMEEIKANISIKYERAEIPAEE